MSDMTDLQALVVGAIIGALAVGSGERGLRFDVEPILDSGGAHTGQIKVRDQETGENVLVAVMREVDFADFDQPGEVKATLNLVEIDGPSEAE